MRSRSGWLVALVTALAIHLISAGPASAEGLSQAIDFSGGAAIPFDSEHRDVYGVGSAIGFGYSYRLTTGDVWLTLDAGYRRASGQEFFDDPTFEFEDAEYWLVPLGIGIRTNLIPAAHRRNVQLYGGASFLTVVTHWEGPFGESDHSSVLGFAVELRPEIAINDRWGFWFRDRFSFLGEVTYDGLVNDLNHSSSTIEAGLRYGWY
jgi:hypothetical protein